MVLEPPTVDPDNIPETLCIGRFNIAAGPGPLATITFTNTRPKAGPLMDDNQIVHESVVRARIVTTVENLTALRDLLSQAIPNPAAPVAAEAGPNELN